MSIIILGRAEMKLIPLEDEGFLVQETVYSNGAYRLANLNGDTLMMPINGKFLKKYYH